jgi:MFS family permease
VLYYSGSFLESAGLHSQEQKLLGYIAIGLCKLIPEALVMLVVDCSGRRPLLTGSSLGVTLVMFALAAAFSYTRSGTSGGGLVIFLLCVYMILFSLGMGPVTWVLSAEMLPSRARAKGMTLCSFVNRLVSGSVALTVLTTSDALGFGGFFLLYATLAAFATAWYWAYVPETKGKTLEEITATFRGEDEG